MAASLILLDNRLLGSYGSYVFDFLTFLSIRRDLGRIREGWKPSPTEGAGGILFGIEGSVEVGEVEVGGEVGMGILAHFLEEGAALVGG